MYASNQEKLIHYFSRYSFGAPYLFTPNEWNKGQAKREPADLVWACNNCIILFYANEKVGAPHLEHKVNAGRRQKSITHNLSQATGWLREWKAGRNLTGKNEFSTFDIPYNQFEYKVIISVVDTLGCEPYKEAIVHQEYANKQGVNGCFTLPLSAIEYAAKNDFSMYDFVKILDWWKKQERQLTENKINILELKKNYYTKSLELADPEKVLTTDKKALLYKIFLSGLRSGLLTIQGEKKLWHDIDVFNDISLKDHFQILVAFQGLITILEKNLKLCAVAMIEGENYLFIIGNSHSNNSLQTFESMNDLAKKHEHKFSAVIFITIFAEVQQPLSWGITEPLLISNTEQLINTWK